MEVRKISLRLRCLVQMIRNHFVPYEENGMKSCGHDGLRGWVHCSFCCILYVMLTLWTPDVGIPALRKLPYDARSRYTVGTVYQCHCQKPIYRRHGISTPQARSRYTGFIFYCILVPECQSHTDKTATETICFHETQRIFMNKFCILTPSGQRTS